MRASFLAVPALVFVTAASAAIHPWDVYEFEMTAQHALANPYVEGLPDDGPPLATAVFTAESGPEKGRTYNIAAFWDGGQKWKVRFAPPAPGTWTYVTRSEDPGLNGVRGTLHCDAPPHNGVHHGPIRVAHSGPRAGRYFTYADGAPMFWLADTWWNWSKPGIHFSSWQKMVDDRAAKGFNVGQVFYGHLLIKRSTAIDLPLMAEVEKRLVYANSRGITISVHGFWSDKDRPQAGTVADYRRYWRYLVHRWGAYDVVWGMAGEYNKDNYGGMGLQFWKDLGALIAREDPYGRLISPHPTPPGWSGGDAAPQWSTAEVLAGEPWLGFYQSQVGHAKWRNEQIPGIVAASYAQKPVRPMLVTEPWYEFAEGAAPAEDIRFGAWSAFLEGAAGHTYGGGNGWWANVPEAPQERDELPLDYTFKVDTLNFPGARSLAFMAQFLRSLEWWTLEPHPELVSEYSPQLCAAVPGREYLVYLRWGGIATVDLRPSSETQKFAYSWIDLTTGTERAKGEVRGGAKRRITGCPEDFPHYPRYKDWLVHIRAVD